MSFDEHVLDDEDLLAQRDSGRLLWSLATAGAQVRRALDTAGEFGLERLRGDDPPRALLVATDEPHAELVLTACASARTASLAWTGTELPRWAGPADALLVASVDGHAPRLAALAAQGAQRGLAMAVVAPAASEVASAGARAALHELPREVHPRAARWSVLAPLLQAMDALGVATVPAGLLVEIADCLDQQAERCRPSGDAFTNVAKSLALELAESVPLVAGAGGLASIAATTMVGSLALLSGVVGLAAALPDEMARAAAALQFGPAHASGGAAGGGANDFFRDRVDDPAARPRPRLILLGDDGTPDEPSAAQRAARRSAEALRDLASAVGVRSSEVDVPTGSPLARFAAATAFGDFAATYLALGLGADPSRLAWDLR